MTAPAITRWCCAEFREHVELAGGRGFGVMTARHEDAFSFVLQHRSLDPGDGGPRSHDRPIAIVSEVRIAWCPWCGEHLNYYYSDVLAALERPDLLIRHGSS